MAGMTALRRRMIEDMKVRNFSPVTQRCYVHAVAKFAQYFKQSPDRLGLVEVRAYQIQLVKRASRGPLSMSRFRHCVSSTASLWDGPRWSSASRTRASSCCCR
jgi:Phage integrase, N-terminal SAM-like domain